MNIRWRSWTFIFNLLLIGGGMYAPNIEKETRTVLIVNGIAGIGLRAKTKEPFITKKDK